MRKENHQATKWHDHWPMSQDCDGIYSIELEHDSNAKFDLNQGWEMYKKNLSNPFLFMTSLENLVSGRHIIFSPDKLDILYIKTIKKTGKASLKLFPEPLSTSFDRSIFAPLRKLRWSGHCWTASTCSDGVNKSFSVRRPQVDISYRILHLMCYITKRRCHKAKLWYDFKLRRRQMTTYWNLGEVEYSKCLLF